jgi:hypothetical protein
VLESVRKEKGGKMGSKMESTTMRITVYAQDTPMFTGRMLWSNNESAELCLERFIPCVHLRDLSPEYFDDEETKLDKDDPVPEDIGHMHVVWRAMEYTEPKYDTTETATETETVTERPTKKAKTEFRSKSDRSWLRFRHFCPFWEEPCTEKVEFHPKSDKFWIKFRHFCPF